MYFSSNSRCVLRKVRFLSPSFLNSLEKNLSIKKPKDDPTKPPLRINIPDDSAEKDDSSAFLQKTKRSAEIRSTAATLTTGYQDNTFSSPQNEIKFSNPVDDILVNNKLEEAPEESAGQDYLRNDFRTPIGIHHSHSVKAINTDMASDLDFKANSDGVSFDNLNNCKHITLSSKRAGKREKKRAFAENRAERPVKRNNWYLLVNFHPKNRGSFDREEKGFSGKQYRTNSTWSRKSSFHNFSFSESFKSDEKRSKNLTQKSQHLSKFQLNKSSGKPNTRFEVHELEDEATYILYLKLNKQLQGKSCEVGCVPEKAFTTRTETDSEIDLLGFDFGLKKNKEHQGFHKLLNSKKKQKTFKSEPFVKASGKTPRGGNFQSDDSGAANKGVNDTQQNNYDWKKNERKNLTKTKLNQNTFADVKSKGVNTPFRKVRKSEEENYSKKPTEGQLFEDWISKPLAGQMAEKQKVEFSKASNGFFNGSAPVQSNENLSSKTKKDQFHAPKITTTNVKYNDIQSLQEQDGKTQYTTNVQPNNTSEKTPSLVNENSVEVYQTTGKNQIEMHDSNYKVAESENSQNFEPALKSADENQNLSAYDSKTAQSESVNQRDVKTQVLDMLNIHQHNSYYYETPREEAPSVATQISEEKHAASQISNNATIQIKDDKYAGAQAPNETHAATPVPDDKYATIQVSNEKHPTIQVLDEKYAATQIQNEKYTATQIPNEKHAATPVPDDKYATIQVSNEKHPTIQVLDEKYAATQIPNEKHAATPVPDDKYATIQVSNEKHPTIQVLDEKYAATQIPNEKYTATQVPNEKYAATQIPNEKYTATQVPNEKYAATQVPSEKYATTQAPNEKYAATQVPNEKYTATQVPNEKYAGTQTPNKKYGATNAPNEKYVATRAPNEKYAGTQTPNKKYGATNAPNEKYAATQVPKDKYTATQAPNEKFVATQVPKEKYAATQVPKDKYTATQVPNEKFVATQVPNEKYAATQVPNEKYAATQVSKDKYAATQVPKEKLAASQVSNEKYAATRVSNEKYAATQVPSEKLAATQVPKDKYAATQVPSEKLAATQVPKDKYAATQVPKDKYTATQVPNEKFVATQVPNEKYAATQVPSEKLAATQVSNEKYAATQVSNEKYAATQVPSEKYAATQVLNENYAATNAPNEKYATTQVPNEKYVATQVLNEKYVATQVLNENYAATQAPNEKYASTPKDQDCSYQQEMPGERAKEDDEKKYMSIHDHSDSTSDKNSNGRNPVDIWKASGRDTSQTENSDNDVKDFQTSGSYVTIGRTDERKTYSTTFGAAFPPLLKEALGSQLKLLKTFNEKWKKFEIWSKDGNSESWEPSKVKQLSENSILFPKKENENFDCECLFSTKDQIILNIIKNEEESRSKGCEKAELGKEIEHRGESSVDSLTVMKKVKEMIKLDLDNAVKIFDDGRDGPAKELSSVVISKGDGWEVNRDELESLIAMRKKDMKLESFKSSSHRDENLGSNVAADEANIYPFKYLPPIKESQFKIQLPDNQPNSVIIFNPKSNEFLICKEALAEAISRKTNEPLDEITQTLNLLASRSKSSKDLKSGDSILVFDDETQSWKVDFSILEKRQQQLQLEEELTKRSELILETFEELEKNQVTSIPQPDSKEKKTFDYLKSEWKEYDSVKNPNEKPTKSKSLFKNSNTEEIRKKNSDLFENLFVAKKKKNGMNENEKEAPGVTASDSKKESKESNSTEKKEASSSGVQNSGPSSKDSEVPGSKPKTEKPKVKEDDNYWETFLNMNILPKDIREISESPPEKKPGVPSHKKVPAKDIDSIKPPKIIETPSLKIQIPIPRRSTVKEKKPEDIKKKITPPPPSPAPPPPSSTEKPETKAPPPLSQISKVDPQKIELPKQPPKVDPPKTPKSDLPKLDLPKQPPKVDPPKQPTKPDPPKLDLPKQLPKVDPPKQPIKPDPPKLDLPKQPPKVDPPKQPTKSDPPKLDLPKQPPKVDPPKQPTKSDPAKVDPPKQPPKSDSPKLDPSKEPPKSDPPKQSPKQPPKDSSPKPDPPKEPPKSDPPKFSFFKDSPKSDPPKDSTSSNSSGKIQDQNPSKGGKTASPVDHYVSDKIIEMSKMKGKEHSKTKTNKIETVKLNITPDQRMPSKVTEINLNKNWEKGKGPTEVQKKPVDERNHSDPNAKIPEKVPNEKKPFYNKFEKYQTPFSDPDYEEKTMKIKSDIASNPSLKKLDNWNKTLVLHDIMKPPESIETWLKDETDKMATLLLKILQEASDGKPKKKQLPIKPKPGENQLEKANPYENIRKKQENTPESFLFRVRTVNLSLEKENKSKLSKDEKQPTKPQKLSDVSMQNAKTGKPLKVIEALKLPLVGKEAVPSAISPAVKGYQLPVNIEDRKNRNLPWGMDGDFVPAPKEPPQIVKIPQDITEDIPGPEILKKISNTWKLIPILDSQVTVFTLFRVFQLANIGRSFLNASHSEKTKTNAFTKLFSKYGPIVNVKGPLSGNVILIHKPEHLAAVFEQDVPIFVRSVFDSLEQSRKDSEEKSYHYDFSVDWNSLEWADLKRVTNDTSMKSCDKYLMSAELVMDSLIRIMRKNRNAQNLVSEDFTEEIKRWSLEGLCSILFEKSFGFMEGRIPNTNWVMEPDKLYIAVEKANQCLNKCERGFQMWRLMPTPSAVGLGQAYRSISSILYKQIYQAGVNLKNKNELLKDGTFFFSKGFSKDLTFVESMLLNDGLSNEEIICNLTDILLIGTNMINSSTGFLLYNLAQNVKVQNKVFKELKEVLPTKASHLDYNKLISLKYLQACIKENLRLHVPIPLFYRQLQNDILLSNYIVPKGTYVVMDQRASNQNEYIFDDPHKFIPERWLSEEKLVHDFQPFTFFPLCHGPRADLAKKVIELQLIVSAAKILRNFLVEYHYGEIQSTNSLISFPDRPLKFNFIERDS